MGLKQLRDDLEQLERQLKSLQSGKRQPGTFGPLLSGGTGSKVAQDKLRAQIEDKKAQLRKLEAKK
jgi:cell division protein FtsB